jgi:hypothetical protein
VRISSNFTNIHDHRLFDNSIGTQSVYSCNSNSHTISIQFQNRARGAPCQNHSQALLMSDFSSVLVKSLVDMGFPEAAVVESVQKVTKVAIGCYTRDATSFAFKPHSNTSAQVDFFCT